MDNESIAKLVVVAIEAGKELGRMEKQRETRQFNINVKRDTLVIAACVQARRRYGWTIPLIGAAMGKSAKRVEQIRAWQQNLELSEQDLAPYFGEARDKMYAYEKSQLEQRYAQPAMLC